MGHFASQIPVLPTYYPSNTFRRDTNNSVLQYNIVIFFQSYFMGKRKLTDKTRLLYILKNNFLYKIARKSNV